MNETSFHEGTLVLNQPRVGEEVGQSTCGIRLLSARQLHEIPKITLVKKDHFALLAGQRGVEQLAR
jgi:hypothetical protein